MASVAGELEEFEKMTLLARKWVQNSIGCDACKHTRYQLDESRSNEKDSIESTLNLASATQYDLADTTDILYCNT